MASGTLRPYQSTFLLTPAYAIYSNIEDNVPCNLNMQNQTQVNTVARVAEDAATIPLEIAS